MEDSNRNKGKVKIEKLVIQVCKTDPKFCGDDNHALAINLMQRVHGLEITADQIRFIVSIDRSRRKVLDAHPEIDVRTKAGANIAKEDAKYYAETKHETHGPVPEYHLDHSVGGCSVCSVDPIDTKTPSLFDGQN